MDVIAARGAGGEAPGVGGVTHPPQSAPAPDADPFGTLPAELAAARVAALSPPAPLPLAESPAPARRPLWRVEGDVAVYALDPRDLAGLSPTAPERIVVRPAVAQWGVPEHAAGRHRRVVARGIDTLYLAIYTELAPGPLAALEELHELARKAGDSSPVYLAAGGQLWRMTWTRAPYTWALDCAAAHVRMARRPGPDAPQCHVEIRSAALWRDGAVAAVDGLLAMLRAWELPRPAATRVEVSRIDLAVDLAGPLPLLSGAELPEGRWVTRAVHRAAYSRSGRLDDDWNAPTGGARGAGAARAEERRQREADRGEASYWRGRHFTGSAFGTGDVRVRCYDKAREIAGAGAGAGKAWFRDVWRAAGWDADVEPTVWRVEVQVRGPALASMVATSPTTTARGRGRGSDVWRAGAVTVGKGWRDVLRALGGIWRYAVGDPTGTGGWLSLRDVTDAAQPTRWPVSSAWREVQAVEWGAVAETYAAHTVEVARLRQRPTAAHIEAHAAALYTPGTGGTGWLPGFEAPAARSFGAYDVARAIDGPEAVAEWGDGPSTNAEAMLLAAVDDRLDFDIRSAEARADGLRAQLVGTAAAYVSAMAVAHRADSEAAAAVEAAVDLVRGAAVCDPEGWKGRMQKARHRAALRGAMSYRAKVAAAYGVKVAS